MGSMFTAGNIGSVGRTCLVLKQHDCWYNANMGFPKGKIICLIGQAKTYAKNTKMQYLFLTDESGNTGLIRK